MKNAIEARHSYRKYVKTPIAESSVKKLEASIKEYNEIAGLNMQLVLNSPEAFDKVSKTYGMFFGVEHYIALVGKTDDELAREKLGYYGEILVLQAVKMGLGTCWVGSSFDKETCAAEVDETETLFGVIVVGNVFSGNSAREKVIRGTMSRKKDLIEMYKSDMTLPDWFLAGMKTVQKAPSARNKQPVMFYYVDGKASAGVFDYDGFEAIDLGIAKLHFEIGAGHGKWNFGNNEIFDETK